MAKKLCLLINSMGGYFICIYIHVYVYIYIYICVCVCVCVCQFSCSPCPTLCTPWTTACQASLSLTNSQRLPKLMSIESVMPSSHFILCRPLHLLPSLSQNQDLSKWLSTSHQVAKVLEFLFQYQSSQWTPDWSPLGWTGWIFLQSKGLSRVFSNTTVLALSLLYSPTLTSIHDYWKNHSLDGSLLAK